MRGAEYLRMYVHKYVHRDAVSVQQARPGFACVGRADGLFHDLLENEALLGLAACPIG